MKQRLAAAALSAALFLSLLVLPARAAAFPDVQGHWARSKIEAAQAYGLISGYPDGRFGVNDPLNRASFVTILCKMFGWEPVSPAAPSFADCGREHWAFGYAEAARAHGVTGGAAFRPDVPITREEMALMLVRALDLTSLAEALSGSPSSFVDVHRNTGYLELARQIGMVAGVPVGDKLFFYPERSASRAEAATMLVQVYERYTAPLSYVHSFYAISSYDQLHLAQQSDAVSLGWAQMEEQNGQPFLNTSRTNGNTWAVPQSPELVTDALSEAGVPACLCVRGDPEAITALLSCESSRAAMVQALAEAAVPYAGLTLDFEGLESPVKGQLTALVRALRSALPAGKLLNICVQPGPWFLGYDFRALGEVCDKVILMAHDYRWASVPQDYVGTARTDCPVTPFEKVYRALTEITDPKTGVADRSKLVLAISMDTAGLKLDENGLLAEAKLYRPSTGTLERRLGQPGTLVQYSTEYRNPCAIYTDEQGDRYKVWYENGRSVTDKLLLARMFGINGVSLWRLGTLSQEVWSAVEGLR